MSRKTSSSDARATQTLSRHSPLPTALSSNGTSSPIIETTSEIANPLFETTPGTPGAIIYVSNVASTNFGAFTEKFDFPISPESAMAIEAVHSSATAVTSGDSHEILTTFLNTTMAGSLTYEQATNMEWKCNEISTLVANDIDICSSINISKRSSNDESDLSKRQLFNWLRSAKHVAWRASVQVLYGALGNALCDNFPYSPHFWCNNANGHNACVSWSNVENWSHDYAREMVADALIYVNFDRFSAQANRVLGSKNRHAADVCISNRAKGCT
ncbi:hypothetical protein E4T47_05706 [Aureobasidium subglaciale]|nr:hypothetical protein E4T47_05706 [Aureobasidium subglaciale]